MKKEPQANEDDASHEAFDKKMWAIVRKRDININRRVQVISRLKSRRFTQAIRDMMKEDGAYDLAFVRTTGKGKKQECDFPPIKWEWVDQSTGYSGDDYSGYIYIQIKENRYARISYAC